jgi:hypothetical protein
VAGFLHIWAMIADAADGRSTSVALALKSQVRNEESFPIAVAKWLDPHRHDNWSDFGARVKIPRGLLGGRNHIASDNRPILFGLGMIRQALGDVQLS